MNSRQEQEPVMRNIFIDKIVLSVSAPEEKLEKGFKLLKIISGESPVKRTTRKRIPSLGVRPGLEIGAMVTLRDKKKISQLLERFFEAIERQLIKKQISQNTFSFGIKEYIEIEGMEYQRDIGIIGFDVTVSFARKGKRVMRRKWKKGRVPGKQQVSKEEIIDYLQKNFKISFKQEEEEQ